MTTEIASAQPESFADRFLRDLLGMVTVTGVAIGETLGLYRALSDGEAVTPAELAERARIAERYAREWLEQQAADGVLVLKSPSGDPAARRYALPAEHAVVLADRESLDFVAPLARLLMAGAALLPEIVEAFRSGGGVPWDRYGDDMREAQGDANRPLFLHQLAQEYLAAIPDVHGRLSSEAGARVAEIGSGMGWAAIGIARSYPNAVVDGYDLDGHAVERARQHAEEAGVADRVRFLAQDAAIAEGAYDLVAAFECLHDMPDPVSVLRAMRAMLAPGGACLVMDERVAEEFNAPADEVERLMYGYSLLVCLPDGLSHQPSVGTGTVMRPAMLQDYAAKAGFSTVDALDLDHPFFRFYRLH